MCGIALICGEQLNPTGDAIVQMVRAIRHRGPDAQSWQRLDRCHLGHTRLSIIDLASGTQPMADVSQRRWIVFNGEIYNYRELRMELLRFGHRFATQSDTEVILAAYAQWGAACLDRFRGMYAFAIWDTEQRKLFAARDLFGEKPLYYAAVNDKLLLGSELKALLASGWLSPALSPSALDGYLALGYVPPDRTIYEHIHSLPPAHYLEWCGGQMKLTRYWQPRLRETPVETHAAAEELRRLLRQAVRRQMVADVPVGAFLSGGHDSSTVVALMSELGAGRLQTFSIGFGKHINELPYARRIAEQYGTEHQEWDLVDPPVASLLERMTEVYDEPFSDPSHVPTYVVSEFARRQVKVVLTGDGADELYGGYAWYPLVAHSSQVPSSTLLWFVLRSVSRLMRDRHLPLADYSRAMGMARRSADIWDRYRQLRQVIPSDRRRMLVGKGGGERPAFDAEFFRPGDDITGFNRALYFDLTAFLPGDILVKVDRAAMAHGLETRAPFLDRDVVEFALSLPHALKVDARHTKILFKQALAQFWPPSIASRGKQGFAAPYTAWLKRTDVATLVQRVFRPGAPLSQVLPGMDRERVLGTPAHAWLLLNLGLWLERHTTAAMKDHLESAWTQRRYG